MGIKGNYLNIIKAIYDKPTAEHPSQWLRAESISSKIRSKTRISTLATFIQHSFGSHSHGHQRRERNKCTQIGKEVKLSQFADDMILYIENPKDATRKLLELINEDRKSVV